MASKKTSKARKKKTQNPPKKSEDEIALESTLRVGVSLDEDNISSSASECSAESDTEKSPAKAPVTKRKKTLVKKKPSKVKQPSNTEATVSTEEKEATTEERKWEAIEIPRVEIEEESTESSEELPEKLKRTSSRQKQDTQPDATTSSDEKDSQPSKQAAAEGTPLTGSSGSSSTIMAENQSQAPPNEDSPIPERALKTVADVAEASGVLRPKLKGDDLPKMADFLPDIRARIDMLKKPSAKNQKKGKGKSDSEQGEEGGPPEEEGEIYGEYRGGNKPKKVMFGIGKNGVERAVIHFREKPMSRPLDVYFDFPNSSLTHAYVYNNVKQQMMNVEGAAITGMQYQDRNVLFGARTVENRWIIGINCVEGRDELIKLGIVIFNRKVRIRKYDEAMEEDYNDFIRHCKTQKNMSHLSEAAAGAGGGASRKSLRGGMLS